MAMFYEKKLSTDMNELYDRTGRLVGEEGLEKLKNAKVLVVGLGGVGGYIAEALARAGVGCLGLLDFDVVDPSNLNRQIIATTEKIGQKKTEVLKERILSINPNCEVISFDFRLDSSKLTELNITSWSYIADAIDDTEAKIALIKACFDAKVPIISSMGTGNKMDPFSYKIAPIEKTDTDPLARALRKKLKELGVKNIPVLYSSEEPKTHVESGNPIPSISYMPAVAGLEIASYIIKNILN